MVDLMALQDGLNGCAVDVVPPGQFRRRGARSVLLGKGFDLMSIEPDLALSGHRLLAWSLCG
jgi:hypothetical protein